MTNSVEQIVSSLTHEELTSYLNTEEKYMWVQSHVLDFCDDASDVDAAEDLIVERITNSCK